MMLETIVGCNDRQHVDTTGPAVRAIPRVWAFNVVVIFTL